MSTIADCCSAGEGAAVLEPIALLAWVAGKWRYC